MDIQNLFTTYCDLFNSNKFNELEELELIAEQLGKLNFFVLSDGEYLRLLPLNTGYTRSEYKRATIQKEKIKKGVTKW